MGEVVGQLEWEESDAWRGSGGASNGACSGSSRAAI
jgi:hypothetical protein